MPEMPIKPDVDPELADEVDRRLADDAAVARAQHAAGDDHLAVGVVGQDGGDVQVVGDHPQAAMPQQGLGHRLGGGADVDDQRTARRAPPPPPSAGDALFGVLVQVLALAIADVLGGGARQPRPAVKTRQQPGVGQQLDVAAHGLQRDAEALGQVPPPTGCRARAPRPACRPGGGWGSEVTDGIVGHQPSPACRPAPTGTCPIANSRSLG